MKESKEDLYAKMGWNVFLDIMHDNMKEEDYQNHYLKDLPEINSVFDDVASGVKPMFRADQRDHVKDMLMSYCAGTMIKGNHVRVMPREAGSKPAETRGVIKLNQRVSNVDKDTAFLPFSTIDTQERRSVYVAYEKKEKVRFSCFFELLSVLLNRTELVLYSDLRSSARGRARRKRDFPTR
jgi:hypothetical protein